MASFYHFYHLTFTEWISLSSLHTPFSQCHHFLSFSLSGSLSLISSADSAHSFYVISMICYSSLTFTEWSKNICTLLLAGGIKNTQTLFIWRHQNQFALSQHFFWTGSSFGWHQNQYISTQYNSTSVKIIYTAIRFKINI